jgi:23S rRNA (guanine745-N1)-methyltransferase
MVAARVAFLAAGHFADLTRAVADLVPPEADRVVDVGAGTGHHLAAVLARAEDAVGLALDASSHALRRAARAHPRIGAVACDAWAGLPVRDAAAGVLLNVFAPRNAAEFHRVLRPGGTLLVVTPGARHLAELVAALGLLSVEERKRERLAATLSRGFERVAEDELERTVRLSRADVAAAVTMGPSSWHTDAATLEQRIARLPAAVDVTTSFVLSRFARRA